MTLQDSYRFSVAVMKERAGSFYRAFSRMDCDSFQDIAAVYAFCRHADDIADRTGMLYPEKALQQIECLENDVEALFAKRTVSSGNPWWRAFSHAVEKRSVSRESLLRQLEGQKFDIFFPGIRSVSDLADYSRKVAGSVGVMLGPMLVKNPEDLQYRDICESLGIGMQITNILRDIGEDLRERNRIYIPSEMLEKYGVLERDLLSLSLGETHVVSLQFVEMWEECALLANQYYQVFFEHLDMFKEDSKIAVASAAILYQGILDAVRENGYQCFTQRCFVGDEEKERLLFLLKNQG